MIMVITILLSSLKLGRLRDRHKSQIQDRYRYKMGDQNVSFTTDRSCFKNMV